MAGPEDISRSKNNGKPPTDALAALHSMGKPPEKKDNEPRENSVGSATGFAAMLARGNQDETSPLPSSSTMGGSATSSAVSGGHSDVSPRPPSRKRPEFAELPEAKLIEVTDEPPQEDDAGASLAAMASIGSAGPANSRPVARSPQLPGSRKRSGPPDWYKFAIPIMLGIGGMLLLIGIWSLLVLAGVHVPLVPRHHSGRAWRNIQWLAEVMLLCLPVSAAMLGLGGFMVYRMMQWPSAATE